MAGGLDWLLKLDSMAVKPGDGLNPKLAELLQAERAQRAAVEASPDVVPINTGFNAAGPVKQSFSTDDLENAGIPLLRPANGASGAQTAVSDPKTSQKTGG
ncbi:MAG: hypothetical protein AAGH68_15010 [Pseudomonadota bacterium]